MPLTQERKKDLYENVVRNMPLDEIEYMLRILQNEREIAGRNIALRLNVGDRVAWTRKGGKVLVGNVMGFGQKNVNVDAGSEGKWRVPPAMLKKCEDVPTDAKK